MGAQQGGLLGTVVQLLRSDTSGVFNEVSRVQSSRIVAGACLALIFVAGAAGAAAPAGRTAQVQQRVV